MSAPPYMKLYVADYLAETTHLGAVGHGAYLLLLMAMWRAGGKLPRDEAKLARVARCSPEDWALIRDDVLAYFQVSGGLLKHKRISKEMAKYQRVVDGSKKAGIASAAKRANKNSVEESTDVGVSVQQKSNQPEPESEPEIEERSSDLFVVPASPAPPAKLPPAWKRDADFVTLWGLATDMMRRRAKSAANAYPAWQKAKRGGDGAEILAGMRGYLAKDPDVGRTGGPGLHIWLNGRTFETYAGQGGAADAGADWPDSRWAMAVELWRTEGAWGDSLGPPPGRPGCRVPPHLLIQPTAQGSAA